MYIDEYIKKIFSYYPCVVMSWGVESMVPIMECDEGEGGISLKLNGYIHKGEVRVILNWLDLFDITLLNPDGSIKRRITDIYVDNLVQVIDEAVEKVPNYAERVKQTYCL